jgi:hypothetical protein
MIYVRPEKTEFPYFPGYVFHTSLLYVVVLPDGDPKNFLWNIGNFIIRCQFGSIVTILYFSLLSHCTSLCYYVVLLSVTILYFPLLSYCIFHHDLFFMQNYEGSYTSLNRVFVLFVLTVVYFWSLQCCPFGFTVTILYFPPYLLVLPLLSCCTSFCHNIVLPVVIILYFPSWLIFYAKLWGVVYFPKLSIRTVWSYYCVLSLLLHILPAPIVLYFLLDNFIIIRALYVKGALPKTEYLYFLSTTCVFTWVIGRTY